MVFNIDSRLPFIGVSVMQVIWFILVLVVGVILVKVLVLVFRRSLKRASLPALLTEFLVRILSVLLYIVVLLAALPELGYDVNSIVLGLSAVIGLILGFGMQDTITNLASGFWITLTQPFDKGDVITTNGLTGSVSGIGIMSTHLLTPDNSYITIPNKLIWGSPIINYTKKDIRRVTINVGVAYGTDLDEAVRIAMDVMQHNGAVLKDPEPSVAITGLADSAITMELRPWVKTSDYWAVKGDVTKEIYREYAMKEIEIPFPQIDVHVKR